MHFTHLGPVGLVNNFRWGEIFDLLFGFAGIDLANDDGKERGHWPWDPAPGQADGPTDAEQSASR